MRGNLLAASGRNLTSSRLQWAASRAGRCSSRLVRASTNTPDSTVSNNAQVFGDPSKVKYFVEPLPAEIEQRLADIVGLIPGLGPDTRLLDVGSGTGCLIPHLQARGVSDITAVDLSDAMLEQLTGRFPAPSVCGNDPGVRTWCGDFLQLPTYMGSAGAVTMNAVFGNLPDPREALLKAALLLQPGGHILISHPMGRAWHRQLHESDPGIVPHELPDQQKLQELTRGLPLQVVAYRDDPDQYAAVLQVPPGYRFADAPLQLQSTVVTGFGRGSRQLGVPTANMDPEPLQQQLQQLPQGVYFGWAQLTLAGGQPADGAVHKMVMNVGRRPTVNTGDEGPTIEVHILHKYSQEEFYGSQLRVVVAGFIRPEIRFAGLPQLLGRIRTDIGIAKSQLDEPEAAALRLSEFFQPSL